MSEYQYYEFQAIDRPLDEADRKKLRGISSRADITSTKFTNVYNYGDFSGSPSELMKQWFDLHLYVANWGTRSLMIRLPERLVDRSQLDGCVQAVPEIKVLESGENLIVGITLNPEDEEYYLDGTDGSDWLDSIAPLRNDALAGDLRLFYILWLTAVERGIVPDPVEEPLPGIGPLSPPHESLAKFLRIDQDLVRAAGESPTNGGDDSSLADVSRSTIKSIPESEKVALLLRLANGEAHIAAEVRQRIRTAWAARQGRSRGKHRTVAELRRRCLAVREERRAREAKRREEERLRKAQEAERERRERLEMIKLRGTRVWHEVETEIGYTSASSYDRAVALLLDLRVLAEESGTREEFARRIQSIRARHSRKRLLIGKLDSRYFGLD